MIPFELMSSEKHMMQLQDDLYKILSGSHEENQIFDVVFLQSGSKKAPFWTACHKPNENLQIEVNL